MTLKALPVKIPENMYNRLDSLARKTHRTKTFYVREALMSYLEDLEDTYLALKVLDESTGDTLSMLEVAKESGFSDEEIKELGLDN